MKKIMLVTEKFSAAHLYHQKKWTAEQNQAEFGKCFTEHGHGHNYRLEVEFQDSKSSLPELQKAVHAVVQILDHQHLNFVVPEFKDLVPTTENIALFLQTKMRAALPTETFAKMRLFEIEDLWVELFF